MTDREDNVVAQVFAIGALFNSLVHSLRRNGILSAAEIDKILDDSLTGLEQAEETIPDEATRQILRTARKELVCLFPPRRPPR